MAETTSRNARKVRTGVVVSISGDKSITVKIDYRKHHPKYGKMMTISKKLHCHDEKNECGLGEHRHRHGDPPAVQDQALACRGDRRARQVKYLKTQTTPCAPLVWAHLWGGHRFGGTPT